MSYTAGIRKCEELIEHERVKIAPDYVRMAIMQDFKTILTAMCEEEPLVTDHKGTRAMVYVDLTELEMVYKKYKSGDSNLELLCAVSELLRLAGKIGNP